MSVFILDLCNQRVPGRNTLDLQHLRHFKDFLANCDLEELQEKNRILPKIQFFTEVSKIILDVIRQNSKLLHLYNQVAISLFQFADKFNCRKEYLKLSDTLHAHFL